MAFAPGQFDQIDPAHIDNDVARAVLDNAQELLKVQLDSVDSLDTKLSTVLGQNATLAAAALGTAGSVFWGSVDAHWIPIALARGLAAAGIVWAIGAGWALWGLRPRQWSTPFFRPSKLIDPEILNASTPAMSYIALAVRLQGGIEQNQEKLKALATDVYAVQFSLLAGALALGAPLLSTI